MTDQFSKKDYFESPHLINQSGEFNDNWITTVIIKLPETPKMITDNFGASAINIGVNEPKPRFPKTSDIENTDTEHLPSLNLEPWKF